MLSLSETGCLFRSLPEPPPERESPPATGTEREYFYEHLEQVLTRSGFLDPENPRLLMRRLRRLYTKAELDQNEVNILRGMLASLDAEVSKDQIE